jgi:DNA-directed RNA polymerase subunit RPC12/RpoP
MSDFKFSCHGCGQKHKAGPDNVGMQIDCPVCKAKIVIPPAPKNPDDVPLSLKPEAKAAQPAPVRAVGGGAKPKAKSLVAMESMGRDPQIGDLTAEVKLDIMQAVHERIGDDAHWMSRRNKEKKYNYAAKVVGTENIPVEIASKDATCFSLHGAILLEFYKRNVTQTASGRNRFLDVEVVEAILEVGLKKPYVPEYQGARPPKGADDDITLTHAETLKVVDLLIKRYEMAAKGISFHSTSDNPKHVRVSDLIRKIEKEEPLTAEEVTRAFQFELKFLDKRITELERLAGRG